MEDVARIDPLGWGFEGVVRCMAGEACLAARKTLLGW